MPPPPWVTARGAAPSSGQFHVTVVGPASARDKTHTTTIAYDQDALERYVTAAFERCGLESFATNDPSRYTLSLELKADRTIVTRIDTPAGEGEAL